MMPEKVQAKMPEDAPSHVSLQSEIDPKEPISDVTSDPRLDSIPDIEANPSDQPLDWDHPDNPKNPRNWSSTKRWSILVLVSAITFNQAMSSTLFAPAVPAVMHDLGLDSAALSSFLVSVYVIGLAVGPMFLAPLSELYGRVPLIHATNFSFLLGAVVCAASPSSAGVGVLLAFRLLMGASTISLGGGYVADLMAEGRRHRAMNVWTVGPVLAPIVGPIAGGYISLSTSWRWTFGLVAITGAVSLVACLFLPETYAPRIRYLESKRRRKVAGEQDTASDEDEERKRWARFRLAIVRPCKMLIRTPIVVLVSLFLAIAYSYMYLMFTTFTDLFEEVYNFDVGQAGLAYLGLGIGSLIGQYALDVQSSWRERKRVSEKLARRPEDQLTDLMLGGVLLGVGLIWYGWTAEYRLHWILPILGTALCGGGIMCFFLAVQTYLVEAFTEFAASALAASSLVRCAFGATIPLCGPPLYHRLGLGVGNTVLAACAFAVVPASFYIRKHGERIRSSSRYVIE